MARTYRQSLLTRLLFTLKKTLQDILVPGPVQP